jgi:hypothetical protein
VKNITLLLILLLVGCSTTKKVTTSTLFDKKWAEYATSDSTFVNTKTDTTKSSTYETTYTKVEFYEPATDSIISKTGPVKSVETWTTKKTEEKKGNTEILQTAKTDSTLKAGSDVEISNSESKEPVPDPKRWRYIFYILLLCVGIFIYLKRGTIFRKIGTWFSKILGK